MGMALSSPNYGKRREIFPSFGSDHRQRRRYLYGLWKRVIAFERSHAASGYGIIWGDADRNKQGGI